MTTPNPVPPADVPPSPAPGERCEGRYPVPGPRDESFQVTYRCGLARGHDGPHCGPHGPPTRRATYAVDWADGPDGYTAGWNAAKAHYEYILSLIPPPSPAPGEEALRDVVAILDRLTPGTLRKDAEPLILMTQGERRLLLRKLRAALAAAPAMIPPGGTCPTCGCEQVPHRLIADLQAMTVEARAAAAARQPEEGNENG